MTRDPLRQAEFYLCLSQAFRAPESPALRDAMASALADDLQDIGRDLELDLAQALAGYRGAVAALPSADSLLQCYSRLFLAPPVPVRINAGFYLDGAVNGDACDALLACYRGWGLDKREDFRDLPDHVALQLEFAAHAFAAGPQRPAQACPASAEEFLGRFVLPWLPSFAEALERVPETDQGPNPYRYLARVLALAVERDALRPAPPTLSRRQAAILRARARHGRREVSEKDLRVIAARLRARGLAVDHLAVPVTQRDTLRGWTHRRPR